MSPLWGYFRALLRPHPPGFMIHDAGSICDTTEKLISRKLLPTDEGENQGNQFLPLSELEKIFSADRVDKIITEIELAPGKQLRREDILGDGNNSNRRIKILAILVYINQTKNLINFKEYQVYDKDLPLGHKSAVFREWRTYDARSFRDNQSIMLAPIFDFSKTECLIFSENVRMPFVNKLEWEKGGRHGSVAKVQIHDAHQSWGKNTDPKHKNCVYALKRFNSDVNLATFENENKALNRYSHLRNGHNHLVKLLMAYEFKKKYFMIFPWAEENLAEFWKKTPSQKDAAWFIEQCRGIASGLRKIHRHSSWDSLDDSTEPTSHIESQNRGRHGDIKPENILVYQTGENRGRLVITDFTFVRFHSSKSVDTSRPNDLPGRTDTYCPPEVTGGAETEIGQRYDSWTLGCVYLEFISWYLLGYDATCGDSYVVRGKDVQSFTKVRLGDDQQLYNFSSDKFFNGSGQDATVKLSVSKWIDMLHQLPDCSEFLHAFLDLIEEKMIVVRAQDRCSIEELCCELERLHNCNMSIHQFSARQSKFEHGDEGFPPIAIQKEPTQKHNPEFDIPTKSTTSIPSQISAENSDYNSIEELFGEKSDTSNGKGEECHLSPLFSRRSKGKASYGPISPVPSLSELSTSSQNIGSDSTFDVSVLAETSTQLTQSFIEDSSDTETISLLEGRNKPTEGTPLVPAHSINPNTVQKRSWQAVLLWIGNYIRFWWGKVAKRRLSY